MIPSNAGTPLYTLPRGVLGHVRSFLTEQEGRTAARACKALAIADEALLEANSKKIANFVYDPQTEHSNLYARVRPLVDTLNGSIGQPPLQNRQHHQAFYDSVRKAAKSLGGHLPKGLALTCEDIRLASAPIEKRVEDEDLVKIWKVISRKLELTPEDLKFGEAENSSDDELDEDVATQMDAEKIRAWMRANKDQLATLKELELSEEGLRCLPKEIGYFTGLQDLNLNGNALVALPSALGWLVHLQRLSAACNRLSQLPAAIGELAKLEVLELDDNKLTSLPSELVRLSRLKSLSLKNNYLSALPETIQGLESLEFLDLGCCPEESDADDRRGLQAHGNRIAQLPERIGALKHLKELRLNGNALRTLTDKIMGLESLEDPQSQRQSTRRTP